MSSLDWIAGSKAAGGTPADRSGGALDWLAVEDDFDGAPQTQMLDGSPVDTQEPSFVSGDPDDPHPAEDAAMLDDPGAPPARRVGYGNPLDPDYMVVEENPTREEIEAWRNLTPHPKGVDINEARYQAQFGLASRAKDNIRRAINNVTGGESEVREGPAGLEYRMLGDNEDHIALRDAYPETYSLVDKPGTDVGDLMEYAPVTMQILSELLPAMGVAAFAGPAGAVITETVMSGLSEYYRLYKGRTEYNMDMTTDEMVDEALKSAGLAAMGGIGLPAIIAFSKAINYPVPKELREIDRDAFAEAMHKVNKFTQEFKERTGFDLEGSFGQIVKEGGTEKMKRLGGAAQSYETAVKKSLDQGEDIAEMHARQQSGITDFADDIFGERRPTYEAGEEIKRSTDAPVEAGIQSLKVTSQAALGAGRKVNYHEQVEQVREAIEAMSDRIGDDFALQYEKFWQDVGKADRRRVKGLSIKEYRKVARDLKKFSLSPRGNNDLAAEAIRIVNNLEGVAGLSYGTMSRSLSDIRALLRSPSLKKDNELVYRDLKRLEEGLRKSRNDSLEGIDPELKARIMRLDIDYAKYKGRYSRDIIGKIMREPEPGVYAMPEASVINRLIQRPLDASRVMSTLHIADGQGIPKAKDAIIKLREATRAKIKEQFFAEGGIATAKGKAYSEFIEKNEFSLRALMGHKEFEKLKVARTARDHLSKMEGKASRLTTFLKETFQRDMDALDGEEIIDAAWGSRKETRKLRNFLSMNDPERLASLRSGFMQKAWDEITVAVPGMDDLAARRLDVDKLRAFRETGGLDNLTAVMTESRARQFKKDFDMLSKAAEFADSRAIRDVTTFTEAFRMDGLTGVLRFARVVAPPLSAKGRGFTALRGLYNEEAANALTEAFADPDNLHMLIQLRNTTLVSNEAKAILGGLGATHITTLVDLWPTIVHENQEGVHYAP